MLPLAVLKCILLHSSTLRICPHGRHPVRSVSESRAKLPWRVIELLLYIPLRELDQGYAQMKWRDSEGKHTRWRR